MGVSYHLLINSGVYTKHGRITERRFKIRLRWIPLIECVCIDIMYLGMIYSLQDFTEDLVKRVGKQKAVIATARKLTKINLLGALRIRNHLRVRENTFFYSTAGRM